MAIINDQEIELPAIDCELERACQLPDGMTYQQLQDGMRQTTEHLKELWKIQEEQVEIRHAVEKDETVLANRLAKLITFYHGLSELFTGELEINLLEVMHAMKDITDHT